MLLSEKMQQCKLIDCQGACCPYGVRVGLQERDAILKHQEITKKLMPDNFTNSQDWFQKKILRDPFIAGGEVIHMSVIKNSAHLGGTARFFLNDHHKCVLQISAEKIGLHKWNLKPFYCILHPLYLDDAGRITLDETDSLLSENGSCLRFSQEKIKKLMSDNFKNSQDRFQKKILCDPFIAGGEVIHTRVIKNSAHLGGTACVFLNDHHKSVLQISAEKFGLHKWNLKPFYCILHPLYLDDAGRTTLDETDSLLSENGSCLRFSQEKISLLNTFEEELLYFLGFEKYQNLLNINKSGNA